MIITVIHLDILLYSAKSFVFFFLPGHHKLHGATTTSDAVHVSSSGASGEQLSGSTYTQTQQVR